jgi:hypothetical protein
VFTHLDKLGVRVRWMAWSGRPFVWQWDLETVNVWSGVNLGAFMREYDKASGKSWIPFMEWADVLEKVMDAEGVVR